MKLLPMLKINGNFEPFRLDRNGDGGRILIFIREGVPSETFTNARIKINGNCEPFRLDRNGDGGGILIFIREGVPSKKLLKHTLPSDVEALFIEVNLRSIKFLLV